LGREGVQGPVIQLLGVEELHAHVHGNDIMVAVVALADVNSGLAIELG
jgi:hypothetical protein